LRFALPAQSLRSRIATGLSLLGGVLPGPYEIAVELFDEIGNLLRIARFKCRCGQVYPLLTRDAGNNNSILRLYPYYSLF